MKHLTPPDPSHNPEVTHNKRDPRPVSQLKILQPAYVFFPPPGECVLQRAVMVRKKLSAREGRGWLSGTLFCTHFRVAFVPQDSPKPDVSPSAQLLDGSKLNPPSHMFVFSSSRRTMQTRCSWGITTWLWPPSRRWWWVSKALHSLRYYYIFLRAVPNPRGLAFCCITTRSRS